MESLRPNTLHHLLHALLVFVVVKLTSSNRAGQNLRTTLRPNEEGTFKKIIMQLILEDDEAESTGYLPHILTDVATVEQPKRG